TIVVQVKLLLPLSPAFTTVVTFSAPAFRCCSVAVPPVNLIQLQVKDTGFIGVFRLVFKPLVNAFPCFGAVCFSLRKKKKLDFTLKVIGGDISTIPGLFDASERMQHREKLRFKENMNSSYNLKRRQQRGKQSKTKNTMHFSYSFRI
ncbi:hypothetical protein J1N35_021712, partial [Gossypium stocksii]